MKSFIVAMLSVACFLIVGLHAAAVESVVEELQKDNDQHSATESVLDTDEACIQPKEIGRCFALFYRYAFDVEKQECVEFIYGGCAGNSNNFETKDDCEAKCMKKLEHSANESATTVVPESKTATEQVVSS